MVAMRLMEAIMINKTHILKNKFISAILIVLISTSFLSACTSQTSDGIESSGETSANTGTVKTITKSEISVEYDSEDEDTSWNSSDVSNIVLNGNSITSDSKGAAVSNNKVTISDPGTYSISGVLQDGQILVNTEAKETVRLLLNGADITNSTSAPIYIKSAKKTVIVLADGTENNITDGVSYTLEDTEAEEPNSAIFSKGDLTINGNGSLTVNANYKNAITSKDELKIMSGNITVNSAADGIKGKDFVSIKNGNIIINAKGDGIQSSNDEDAEKGFVFIEGGTVNITAAKDAIQAETSVLISNGDINISSGGGSANGIEKVSEEPGMRGTFDNNSNSDTDNPDNAISDSSTSDSISTKGIKAVVDITIEGGTLNIDSADDSLHSNNSLTISGGNTTISSGDDGIHSDSIMEINGGDINIKKSYEGIESAVITINTGNIHIISSDDGINIAGGNDASSTNGRPGQNNINTSSNNYLNINGGYVSVDANGDGLDSNGSIKITDGTVLVNGPASNGNGALDYDGSFVMTGGLLIAAGSSGMAQAPDTSSTQYSAMVNFSSTMSAGTMVHIQNAEGKEILSFVPTKEYQTVVLCSPEIKSDSAYDVYYEGSSTGTNKDGLYSGGTYTGGTKFDSFTVSSIVTNVGTVNNRGMGGGGGNRKFGK